MNKLKLVSFLSLILLFACQSSQEDTSAQDTLTADDTNDTVFHGIKDEINSGTTTKECYLEVDGKDSLKLSIEINEEMKVTGQLEFINYQMDSSRGDVNGEIIGDTLILIHEFQAEGTFNRVQRVFLRKNNQYLLGKGSTEEVDGTYIYLDRSLINFENTRILDRIECDILQ